MTLANLRDAALCYFIVIAFSATLLPGAVFLLLAMGLRILKRRILPYFHLAQFYSRRVWFYTDRASRVLVSPILFAGGWSARIRNYAGQFEHWLRQEEG
jgi:NhaP-type Na+/H+ or K+/H+ antiporter